MKTVTPEEFLKQFDNDNPDDWETLIETLGNLERTLYRSLCKGLAAGEKVKEGGYTIARLVDEDLETYFSISNSLAEVTLGPVYPKMHDQEAGA